MGLPTYNCPEDLAESVPATLTPHGIRVMPHSASGCRHAYIFRRGLGTVKFGEFVEKEGGPHTFRLVCGSNPLFWFFDMRLLSRVERVLLSHGASHWNPDENIAA
jgi:hypothetical protein